MDIEEIVKLRATRTRRYTVEETDTAEAVGSGSVKLLATPQMIAWMEQVAHGLLGKLLPAGMVDLGVEVFVRHFNPAEVGEKVTVEARVVQVMGSRVTFEVGAETKGVIVGRGTHVRQIVSRGKRAD